MKKSLLLSIIFGLGMLISMPKAEAIPTIKKLIVGALGAASTTVLMEEIHAPIKTVKAANLEEAINKVEKNEKLQRLGLLLTSFGIGLANGMLISMPKTEAVNPILKHVAFLLPSLIGRLSGNWVISGIDRDAIAQQAYFGRVYGPGELIPKIAYFNTHKAIKAVKEAEEAAETKAKRMQAAGLIITGLAYIVNYLK